ncbi:MAG: hypothetical protein V3U86_11910, partial [Acidobacteriota bacterium]
SCAATACGTIQVCEPSYGRSRRAVTFRADTPSTPFLFALNQHGFGELTRLPEGGGQSFH